MGLSIHKGIGPMPQAPPRRIECGNQVSQEKARPGTKAGKSICAGPCRAQDFPRIDSSNESSLHSAHVTSPRKRAALIHPGPCSALLDTITLDGFTLMETYFAFICNLCLIIKINVLVLGRRK